MKRKKEIWAATRDIAAWEQPMFEYANLLTFLAADAITDGVHSIMGERAPIDIFARVIPGAPLLVCFHANLPTREDFKLPVFNGRATTHALSATYVAISDPSLYLDPELTLGWHAGARDMPYQAMVVSILKHIKKVTGAPKIIMFGGSGGGFASLYYGARLAGSTSIAWNPQIDIAVYKASAVAAYGKAAFGFADFDETEAKLDRFVDSKLHHVYDKPTLNNVIYLQNSSDSHVGAHLATWLEAKKATIAPVEGDRFNGLIDERSLLFLQNWGDGHAAPPNAFIRQVLEICTSRPLEITSMIKSGEMSAYLDERLAAALG